MRKLLVLLILASCSKTTKTYFIPSQDTDALQLGKVVSSYDSGYEVAIAEDKIDQLKAISPQSFDLSEKQVSAYSFSSMETKLKQLAQDYPNLATLTTYGTSRQGRPQYALVVSNKFNPESKPQYMITAATHGNEVITVDTVLGLAERLLKGFDTDERMAKFVNYKEIHFIPAVCVDSYVAQTRENEGRDPNRDYPWPDRPSRNPVKAIADIIAYFEAHDFVGTMDYHSAASMYMYPWAYTYDPIPADDKARLDALTTHMAETNGFAHGDIASTIYIAAGSSADYYYWKKRSNAIAVEVSHNLAYNDATEENAEATWRFLEAPLPSRQ